MSALRLKLLFNKPINNYLLFNRLSSEAKGTTSSSKSGKTEANADNSSYKVPEYYKHNVYSYYDIDASMSKKRVPQPSKYGQPQKKDHK